MLRNLLAASLRHLARNRLYAAISVFGLAIGLAAALLAALVLHSRFAQDHFIPGHERIFLAMTVVQPPDRAAVYNSSANNFVGPQLRLRLPGIKAMTRLFPDDVRLQRGEISATERIYWADTNAFDLLSVPVVAGDLHVALARPDTAVLSRAVARKYFGRDAPLGETLLLEGGGPLTVTAVIEDLPATGSHLRSGIFLSTLSPRSSLQKMDRIKDNGPGSPVGFGTMTYLQLAPGFSAAQLRQALLPMAGELFSQPPQGWKVTLRALRMDELETDPGLNPGVRGKLAMTMIVGLAILLIALANFLNLLTARLLLRAPEVAIRKLAGASRGMLVLQFVGEIAGYVCIALLLAVALIELLLPYANAFLATGITFSYWQHPGLMLLLLPGTLLLGVLIGGGPALLLSALRPLQALRARAAGGRNLLRQGLVTLQFTILIALMIAAGVLHQQWRYASSEALHLDTDQLLLIRGPCGEAFVAEVRRLSGVRDLACGAGLLGDFSIGTAKSREGIEQLISYTPVQPGLLQMYGVRPLAGRLDGDPQGTYYVLNETAAYRLGFARPDDAIGSTLPSRGPPGSGAAAVIGVVPDFSLNSVEKKIEATAYRVSALDPAFNVISVKLIGAQIPETLAAIDAVWKKTGARDAIVRFFADEYIQRLYTSMLREAQLFAGFAVLAVLLACLGLLGLAAAVAERRTREIGIRKALGAQTSDVARLLLWEFARPVLWANLIAWPVTGWLMQRWLQGYAYHVDLPLWLFPAAGLATLLIALATVTVHALRVAGAKPVTALRYE
jgi:putative ABC transport system permease protein